MNTELIGSLGLMARPRKLDVPQKPLAAIPKPSERPPDWIASDAGVAIVLVENGKVRIRPGSICSAPGSHGSGWEVDNIRKTIVWTDDSINPGADSVDDAHEACFDPKDPRLLRLDEIEYLKDPERAVRWFTGAESPEIARIISGLLSKPDFGRQDELTEYAEASRKGQEAAKAKLGYYEGAAFHPPITGAA